MPSLHKGAVDFGAPDPRFIHTDEEYARVLGRAFVLWTADQFTMSPCCRISWADATDDERLSALEQAAKELGYSV
jgi:hypothetical protein